MQFSLILYRKAKEVVIKYKKRFKGGSIRGKGTDKDKTRRSDTHLST